MCGIVGFVTSDKYQGHVKLKRDYVRQALIADTIRGPHATGIFYGVKNGGVGWAKECAPGHVFVESKNYEHIDTVLPDCWFAVGHNRWATVGDNDKVENAHPFKEGPITLVHNGTLYGDGGLKTTQKDLGVAVDSHAICHNLAVHPAVEVLEGITGAFALVWYDKRDNTINFARNASRQLWLYKTSSNMFFASEKMMLEWLLDRNNGTQKNVDATILPVGEHLKFPAGSLTPEVTKFGAPKQTYNQRQYNWDDGLGGYDYEYGNFRPNATGNRRNAGSRLSRAERRAATIISDRNAAHNAIDNVMVTAGANALLNEAGFDKIDRLPFIPLTQNGLITVGTIKDWDQPVFLLGVNVWDFKTHEKKLWTIRPCGIRMMPNKDPSKKDDEVLMARLVKFSYDVTDWEYGQGWLSGKSEKTPALPAPKEDKTEKKQVVVTDGYRPKLYPGPNGAQLSIHAWSAATNLGCTSCSDLPVAKEADQLLWDDHGEFTCLQCQVAEKCDATKRA
jgi:hypothetical protein